MQKSRFNQLGAPLGPERDVRPPQNPEALIRQFGEIASQLANNPLHTRAGANRIRREQPGVIAQIAERAMKVVGILNRRIADSGMMTPVELCPSQPERADEPAYTHPEALAFLKEYQLIGSDVEALTAEGLDHVVADITARVAPHQRNLGRSGELEKRIRLKLELWYTTDLEKHLRPQYHRLHLWWQEVCKILKPAATAADTPCAEASWPAATDTPQPGAETELAPDVREVEPLNSKYDMVAALWAEKIGLKPHRVDILNQYLRSALPAVSNPNETGGARNQIRILLARTQMQLFSDQAVLDTIGAMRPIEQEFVLMVFGAKYHEGRVVPTVIRNFQSLAGEVLQEYAEQAPVEQGAAAAEKIEDEQSQKDAELGEFKGVYRLLEKYPGHAHALK